MSDLNNMSHVNNMSYINNITYINNTSYVCRLYELYELYKSYKYFCELLKIPCFLFGIFSLIYKDEKPKLWKLKF